MQKTLNLIYWLILIVVVLVAATVILSAFNTPLKVRLFSVQSGSMEPTIHVGSIVINLPQTNYQKGDIITLRSERSAKETVTHRINDIQEEDGLTKYQTKGDANEDPDRELVPGSRVIGKVVFSLPYVGYVVGFAQTQIGFIVLVVIPATLIIASEVINIKKEIFKLLKHRGIRITEVKDKPTKKSKKKKDDDQKA